jgi:hypothetical protein
MVVVVGKEDGRRVLIVVDDKLMLSRTHGTVKKRCVCKEVRPHGGGGVYVWGRGEG